MSMAIAGLKALIGALLFSLVATSAYAAIDLDFLSPFPSTTGHSCGPLSRPVYISLSIPSGSGITAPVTPSNPLVTPANGWAYSVVTYTADELSTIGQTYTVVTTYDSSACPSASPPVIPFSLDFHIIPGISNNATNLDATIYAPFNELWWMNGLSPSGYQTTVGLTANAGAASYEWSISSDGAAEFSGHPGQATVTTSVNYIDLVSLGPTTSAPTVVTVTVNGAESLPQLFFVRAPTILLNTDKVHSIDSTFGYLSELHYMVLDQFGIPLPGSVPFNEEFTTPYVADYSGMDWRRGSDGGTTVDPADVIDRIEGEQSTRTPTPQNPGSPLGATAIYHWDGSFSVGGASAGAGARVQTHRWQKYRDHADHENTVSPAP